MTDQSPTNQSPTTPTSQPDDEAWAQRTLDYVLLRVIYASQAMSLVSFASDDFIRHKIEEASERAIVQSGLNREVVKHLHPEPAHQLMGLNAFFCAQHAMQTAAVNFLHVALEDTCTACLQRLAERRHPQVLFKIKRNMVSACHVIEGRPEDAIQEALNAWLKKTANESLLRKLEYLRKFAPPIASRTASRLHEQLVQDLDRTRHEAIHKDGDLLESFFANNAFNRIVDDVVLGINELIEDTLAALKLDRPSPPGDLPAADQRNQPLE